jgi:hypothetical protein
VAKRPWGQKWHKGHWGCLQLPGAWPVASPPSMGVNVMACTNSFLCAAAPPNPSLPLFYTFSSPWSARPPTMSVPFIFHTLFPQFNLLKSKLNSKAKVPPSTFFKTHKIHHFTINALPYQAFFTFPLNALIVYSPYQNYDQSRPGV